jgi:polyisoprenoid-binding protein YceI
MKTILIALLAALTISSSEQAERLVTRDAYVRFFSTTPIEDIEGITKQASSVLDTKTGAIAFKIPMKSFFFEKALMQEHFNENYVESDKFPNASLKASVENWNSFYSSDNTELETQIEGEITIHGVTKPLKVPAKFTKKGENILLDCDFEVATADFDIEIPAAVRNKIAEKISVTVKAKY